MSFLHCFDAWLSHAKELHADSETLLKASKDDPSDEPYRSKYKAKDILCKLLEEIETYWFEDNDSRVILIWALLKYEIGVILLETEECAEGCDNLTVCWERIQGFSCEPAYCILSLNILNQLGILWSNRNDFSKASIYLTVAEKLYQDFKSNHTTCPYTLESIFENDTPTDGWNALEKTYTLTLYYLAQVYEHMKESAKSAEYCHMTLKRQRDYNDFDEKEWSINCATLSQYYIQEKNFEMGRHLLACAEFTVKEYEAILDNRVEDYIWDDVKRSKAEIAWCWAKYAINLLLEYKDFEMDEITNKEDQVSKLIKEHGVLVIETRILVCISSYIEAKKVFCFGQNQIKEAQKYYTLDTHANNYIQLMQDISKLYKCLIDYESDMKNQCKMHKRRIDILEIALSNLNPKYYLSLCRQLRFELGETYYELIDLKFKMMTSSREDLSVHFVKKANYLMIQCIDHFSKFIESIKTSEGVLPDIISDDLLRPVLIAHFYLGRLYLKILESDVPKKLQNLSKCEEYYKFILKYSEKNPSHANIIENELPLVKEMLEIIPEKKKQIIA